MCNFVRQTESYYYGLGGAIYSNFSTLLLTGQSIVTFSENRALHGSGGAIAVMNGGSFINEVSASFYNNNADYRGGAILLKGVDSKFLGSICFNENAADYGGALHIVHANVSFNVIDNQAANINSKGVSTIEATEAAASVIYANSYMYSQLSTLHGVDYNTYSATLTWFSVHSE